ncbi:sensor histidine kinase [Telmatospirillum sp.]|uniref:sensor histidine kinase n=1 Tax=Telmatospirillum sp. TaxID=2079197 RepID=UPI00284984D6|nr:sensor histidine kinase [Telmatospirillum sp.]MDR3437801.1 sensor histidine kinase [Telmatospirillum sp.]
MSRRAASLHTRLLLGSLAWIVMALVATGIILTGLFRETVEHQFDSRLAEHLDQLLAVARTDVKDGIAVTQPLSDPRFRRPFSGLYWQIDGPDGPRLRSRSLWDSTLALPPDATSDGELHWHRIVGPEGQDLIAVERTVQYDGPAGSVRAIVAGDAHGIDEATGHFTRILSIALFTFALGLAAAAAMQVRGGLAPLRKLRAALGAIRRGQASRLEGRYPKEIQPLIDDLNALVEHNSAVVARARSQAGDLAHSLKTPLSILINASQSGAASDNAAAIIRQQAALMRRQIDYHLTRARAAGAMDVLGANCPVEMRLDALRKAMSLLHADKKIDMTLAVETDLIAPVEAQDFDEMLGNLLDNACKWAVGRISVTARNEQGDVVISVEDDGPGLSASEREAVFERGRRLDEATPGSGLGLAIVRDLAMAYGGTIRLDESPLGGVRCRLSLPMTTRTGTAS